MWRGSGIAVLVLATALRATAADTPPPAPSLAVDVTFGDALVVTVSAENSTAAARSAVGPEVRHRLVERHATPVTLAPGARHTWTETLPLPPGPGGSVLVVLLRWTEPDGTRRSRPFVRVVDTPGLLPTEAQLLLEPTPVAGRERATARITNATGTPLRGRLVAHLPVEHFTTPVAQPVDVPPRQTIAVPIDVQSDGPAGTTYPVYVALEFEQGGLPRAIVAGAELGIGVVAGRSKVRPLAVGATALLAAAAVVFLANRRAARRRTERDRVDGRVTHT